MTITSITLRPVTKVENYKSITLTDKSWRRSEILSHIVQFYRCTGDVSIDVEDIVPWDIMYQALWFMGVCHEHYDDLEIHYPITTASYSQIMSNGWDNVCDPLVDEHGNRIPTERLPELAVAASYLGSGILQKYVALKFATLMLQRQPHEVRQIFKLKHPWTPDDEDRDNTESTQGGTED